MYIMITAVPTVEAPSMNCLALVYKKYLSDKVMMNLTAIQDMGHLKKVNLFIIIIIGIIIICL